MTLTVITLSVVMPSVASFTVVLNVVAPSFFNFYCVFINRGRDPFSVLLRSNKTLGAEK